MDFQTDKNQTAKSSEKQTEELKEIIAGLADIFEVNQKATNLENLDTELVLRKEKSIVTKQLSDTSIVLALAENTCERLTRKIIRDFQLMKDALTSSEGFGLLNTWDEICVQVQVEESIYWHAYDETVYSIVDYHVGELPTYEREAIWLQTPEGIEWDCENDDEREPYPVFDKDIIDYIMRDYVYLAAINWSNQRIRNFRERAYSID